MTLDVCCEFPCMQANRRYSHQLTLSPDYDCVLEDDGGILLASKCLAALQVSQCYIIILIIFIGSSFW